VSDDHEYVVQPGDSMATICASRGMPPSRAWELAQANPQKSLMPGTTTFTSLYAGEVLAMPESWPCCSGCAEGKGCAGDAAKGTSGVEGSCGSGIRGGCGQVQGACSGIAAGNCGQGSSGWGIPGMWGTGSGVPRVMNPNAPRVMNPGAMGGANGAASGSASGGANGAANGSAGLRGVGYGGHLSEGTKSIGLSTRKSSGKNKLAKYEIGVGDTSTTDSSWVTPVLVGVTAMLAGFGLAYVALRPPKSRRQIASEEMTRRRRRRH